MGQWTLITVQILIEQLTPSYYKGTLEIVLYFLVLRTSPVKLLPSNGLCETSIGSHS